jgi:hypothetical protein
LGFAPDGDILVTGSFFGGIDLGGGPLVSAGMEDMFLARFSPTGAHVRSDRFGDASYQRGACVATDAAGNLFAGGFVGGTMTIDGIDLVSHGQEDIYLARLAF